MFTSCTKDLQWLSQICAMCTRNSKMKLCAFTIHERPTELKSFIHSLLTSEISNKKINIAKECPLFCAKIGLDSVSVLKSFAWNSVENLRDCRTGFSFVITTKGTYCLHSAHDLQFVYQHIHRCCFKLAQFCNQTLSCNCSSMSMRLCTYVYTLYATVAR